MTVLEVNTTYEPYSEHAEYIEATRGILDILPLEEAARAADLACGTGLLSRVLFERKPDLAICGVDLDAEQIAIARRKFGAFVEDDLAAWRAHGAGRIHLRVGSADDLAFLNDGELDLVVMGNAIHLMPDRHRYLAEVARVLRPGGRFAFNSVFFTGTFPAGTEPVYSEWLRQAVLYLEEMNAERARQGLPPVPRQRGKARRAFSKDWLSADGWSAALEGEGFAVEHASLRATPITREGLKLVGAYGGLATVLMSGYPVEVASTCLQVGAERAFDALGLDAVPRNWLEVAAVRR
jgi:ubiquinone/menaquinone biosynthesis C-methylase UbiE